jgi:hypothetical protein
LNEADDELVNVNLVDAQRTAHLKKVKARAKLPVYSGLDDAGDDHDTAEGAAAAAAAFRAVEIAVLLLLLLLLLFDRLVGVPPFTCTPFSLSITLRPL